MAKEMNLVNWFEIPVNDLDRSKAFYEHVFGIGLSLNEMGPFKMAWFPRTEGAPSATGEHVEADGYTPSYSGTLKRR